jgi:uncharacterized protein
MPLQPDGYTFVLSNDVSRTPVRYRNRYGIEIAADLYRAKDLDESATHPAVVVGPPHGGVKEQGPGVYAQELARRGFVAIGFDPSYNGESGREPRHVTSPELFAEDFSAGVDFLGALSYVDRERIGVIGICGSGGFALSAAQVDPRIKAVATAAVPCSTSHRRSMSFSRRTCSATSSAATISAGAAGKWPPSPRWPRSRAPSHSCGPTSPSASTPA